MTYPITPTSRAFVSWMIAKATPEELATLKAFTTHRKDLMTYYDYAKEKHPEIFERFVAWRAKQKLL